MIFTPEELQRLFNIIDFRFAKIAADVLGDKVLSKQDILLLDKYAPKWRNELKKFPPYYQSYLFGRLSGVLSKKQLDSLSYKDFEGYLTKMQFEKPTQLDMSAYEISLKKTYSYLKGIGDRVKTQLGSSVSNQEMQILVEKQRQKDLETIKEELSRGVLEKKSVPQIVSDIGHKLDEWQHDWGRVVETEMQNIYELGAAQRIAKEHGIDAKVYKTVYGGACNFCIRFYTTNGIGSKPRIFKLADLMANGTNVGRKQKDWLPTVGPVHPFCRCVINWLPDDYIWSDERQRFEMKPYKRKIERRSKVTITVGDKKFEV